MISAMSRIRDSIPSTDHHWIVYVLGFLAVLVAMINSSIVIRMYVKLPSDKEKTTELKNDMVFSAVSVAVSSIVLVLLSVSVAKKW
jgi:hypothetical protein